MKSKFIPLHVHSEYSSLDGAIMISEYVNWACSHNLPAVAVTDHGIMASAVPLKRQCDAVGIKPIMGCELYAESFTGGGQQENYHLLALPLTQKGFKTLIRLLSLGYKDNFYKKPRISLSMLEEIGCEDIFFSTACVQGELSQMLLRNDREGAVRFIDTMKALLKDNFAVELIDTGPDAMVSNSLSQYELNQMLYDLAHSCGVKTIMTTDSHYFTEDKGWYNALLAAQMKTTQEAIEAEWGKPLDLSLRSPDEMWERWRGTYTDALLNTVEIAERVENFPIALDKPLLPKLRLDVSLHDLAKDKLERKITTRKNKEEYRARLDRELSVISQMGYEDYFLMVWDAVNWARQQGIAVGPGRGSAAGSLLAYVLEITQVDPLQHGLLFERFLNPERVNMPDIDLDFEDARRDEIIGYLRMQYGENAVVPIANYIRMHLKAALRDAMRVLGHDVGPNSIGDSFVRYVSSQVDETEEYDYDTLMQVAQGFAKLESGVKADVLRLATKLSNRIRNYSKHACGVVIAPPDVIEYAPLYRLNNEIICQYNMDAIDYMNLVKMDILGLSTLTVLRKTYENALVFDRKTPSPDDIYMYLNYGDEGYVDSNISLESVDRAYNMLQAGDTTGVFQMFSSGMRKLLRALSPQNIEDLSVLIALYRPGPLSSNITNTFVNNRKYGRSAGSGQALFPQSMNAVIEGITSDSDGLPIYQEHVMRIAQEVAGYSLGEADLLRRAMGKKKAELMQSLMETFVERSVKQGYTEEDARQTFEVLQHFAGYGFNKSHSMAYAFLAFATAWYKANRPAVFWAAFLDSKRQQVKREELATFLREVRAWHTVLYPMVLPNESTEEAISTRAVRDAGGIALSASEVWKSNQCWKVILGLNFIKGFAGGKLENLKNIPSDVKSLEELAMFMVVDHRGKAIPEKQAAAAFMGGFFDYLFKDDFQKRGVSPLGFRTALLMCNSTESMPKDLVAALSKMMGVFKKSSMSTEEWVRKELLKVDRDFFTAVFGFTVSKLRSRMQLKRSWDVSRIQGFIEDIFSKVVDCLCQYSQTLSERASDDAVFKRYLRSLIYEQEREVLGEGVILTRDMLFKEQVDIWAEEFYMAKKKILNGQNYELSFLSTDGQLRIGGYVNQVFQNKEGGFSLVLEGRFGSKFPAVFVPIGKKDFQRIKNHIGDLVVVEGGFTGGGHWQTREVKTLTSIAAEMEVAVAR